MLRACLFAWVTAQQLALAPSTTDDQPLETVPRSELDEPRAREAWARGAKAFGDGHLQEAIEQFELTYRYSGRPGPLFSLGQAHRHLWEQGKDDRQRVLAIQRYEQYLAVDPEGRRKLEAERWITLLQKEAELEDLGEPPPIFTRLAITSPTPGAHVSIDHGASVALPFTPDVAPGRHVVIASAPGYRTARRELELPAGSTLPIELELVPLDALLTVRGPAGAELWIDGERVARLPTRGPVPVTPGAHQIGVAQRGRTLFVRDVELDNAERERIDAPLERTGQRKVAISSVAVGTLAAAASVVVTSLAFDAQRRARVIQDQIGAEGFGVPKARYDERTRQIERRDALRSAAIGTGVTGLALIATGVLLWISDRPPTGSRLQRPKERVRVQPGLDAGAGFAGGFLRGAF